MWHFLSLLLFFKDFFLIRGVLSHPFLCSIPYFLNFPVNAVNVLLFVVQIMIPWTTYLLLDECKNIFLLYLTMNVNMNIKKYLSTLCNCECNCVKYLILSDKFKLFPKMVMPVTLYHLSLKFMCQGASVRNSAHGKGHEEGGLAYTKTGSSLRSPPGNSRASTPKTRVCLLSALCSHLHLWLYGGLSPTTSLKS